jgi:nicotinate-nucleotide adenylyltransferase
MRIAIFSGSFDPPHNGHLAVAEYLCAHENFDEVWFIITPHNPLKERSALSPEAARTDMVLLAIEGRRGFRICDIECALPQPSYTINTLIALQACYPHYAFTLVIGADNWVNRAQWKDYQRIIDEFGIVVYPRHGYDISTALSFPRVKPIPAPEVQVSSSAIKEALKRRKNIRHLVPKNVYTYIKKHNLYDEKNT